MPERSEVYPIPKQTRPWKCGWSNPTCTRSAPCPRCRGKRARNKGLRKQRQARKGLVPDPLWWSELANEENWRGALRLEVKSGQQVKGIASRYLQAENQALAAKAIGDLRPFAMVAMPDGWGSEGLAVVRLSVLRALLSGVIQNCEATAGSPDTGEPRLF